MAPRLPLSVTSLIALSADPAGTFTAGNAYWSTTLKCVRVYDGTGWVSFIQATVGTTAPASPVTNQLWFDTNEPGIQELSDQGITTPAVPSAGLKLFARSVGGSRRLPAFYGPSGDARSLQAWLARTRVRRVSPIPNSTSVSSDGVALTTTGTATAAAIATTNLHTSLPRLDYLVTVASTSAVAGFYEANTSLWRGNGTGLGGFTFVCRFSPATGTTGTAKRLFIGLAASTSAPTDADPAGQQNMIGVGYDDTSDANWQILNNAASTASKTDLGGTNFAIPTTDRPGVWELCLYAPPNGSAVGYEFTNLVSGQKAVGTLSTNLPASTTLLAPRGYASVGGANSVIGLTLFGLHIETDV